MIERVAAHIFRTFFGVSFVVLCALDYMLRTFVPKGYNSPLVRNNRCMPQLRFRRYLNAPKILGRKLQYGSVSRSVVLLWRVLCERNSRERSLREGRADRVLRIDCILLRLSFFEFLGTRQFAPNSSSPINQNSKKWSRNLKHRVGVS
mgnify:CR=1 FL=1